MSGHGARNLLAKEAMAAKESLKSLTSEQLIFLNTQSRALVFHVAHWEMRTRESLGLSICDHNFIYSEAPSELLAVAMEDMTAESDGVAT